MRLNRNAVAVAAPVKTPRNRASLRRSRSSLLPAVQITVGAVGAYAFAEQVLGHEGPLFAATSALIALNCNKPIFVFDEVTEVRFLRACDPWTFAIQFTLAKTTDVPFARFKSDGMRV